MHKLGKLKKIHQLCISELGLKLELEHICRIILYGCTHLCMFKKRENTRQVVSTNGKAQNKNSSHEHVA